MGHKEPRTCAVESPRSALTVEDLMDLPDFREVGDRNKRHQVNSHFRCTNTLRALVVLLAAREPSAIMALGSLVLRDNSASQPPPHTTAAGNIYYATQRSLDVCTHDYAEGTK